jgi:hypothetical protein
LISQLALFLLYNILPFRIDDQLRHMAHGIWHKNTDIKMIIQEANQEKEITLYMRIGGKKRIAAIVDEIIL